MIRLDEQIRLASAEVADLKRRLFQADSRLRSLYVLKKLKKEAA